jgi:hypothetical protein
VKIFQRNRNCIAATLAGIRAMGRCRAVPMRADRASRRRHGDQGVHHQNAGLPGLAACRVVSRTPG